jgi:hypothetical protein
MTGQVPKGWRKKIGVSSPAGGDEPNNSSLFRQLGSDRSGDQDLLDPRPLVEIKLTEKSECSQDPEKVQESLSRVAIDARMFVFWEAVGNRQ